MTELEQKVVKIVTGNILNADKMKQELNTLVIEETQKQIDAVMGEWRSKIVNGLEKTIASAVETYVTEIDPSQSNTFFERLSLMVQKALLRQTWFVEPLKAKILLDCTKLLEDASVGVRVERIIK